MIRFLFRRWLQSKGKVALLLALLGAGVLLDLLGPLNTGHLVSRMTEPGENGQVFAAAIILLATFGFLLVQKALVARVNAEVATNCVSDFTLDGFTSTQRLDEGIQATRGSAVLIKSVRRGAWSCQQLCSIIFANALPQLLVVLCLVAIFAFRWPLAGLLGMIVAVAFVLIGVFGAKLFVTPRNLKVAEGQDRIAFAMSDYLTNIATVRAFGNEALEQARISGTLAGWRTRAISANRASAALSGIQGFLLGALLIVLTGAALLAGGEQLMGAEIAFGAAAFVSLTSLLRAMIGHIQNMITHSAHARDMVDLLSMEATVKERPDALALDRVGALPVSFEEVSFAYPGGERVIEDIALEIAAGEKVALIGATGSGKSTLVKLIQRLYDPGTGIVKVGGHDVRNLQIESLRRAVGIVPQDPVMFHRSVMENIAYGRPEATLEEVRAAAAMARADEFIMRMPEGYQSLVGERGVKLSGGERQRIAIARAFLADPPILVLDEATSSLDAITEKLIQEAVEQLLAQRTAIVIAHRLSTIRNVDRILVLDRGRILEQGSHQDLIEHSGKYAQLLQAQQMDG